MSARKVRGRDWRTGWDTGLGDEMGYGTEGQRVMGFGDEMGMGLRNGNCEWDWIRGIAFRNRIEDEV